MKPITLKIDMNKVETRHFYRGAKGTYLDIAIWPNKNGTGQYGDTHYCVQQVSKDARANGERGPIIGNATFPTDDNPLPPAPAPKKLEPTAPAEDIAGQDEIPF